MRTRLFFIAMLLTALAALPAADAQPPFSWEKVPVYAHVGKTAGDFTAGQLDFLARHFDLIAFEKGQAVGKNGDTETGIAVAARQIKRRNPRAKVLFYWNVFLDYPLYKASRILSPDSHLKDQQDKPVLIRDIIPAYDLTHDDVRGWWSDTAAAAVRDGGADGIFIDALALVAAPRMRTLLGPEKYDAVNDGLVAMLKETQRKLGPEAIILYNGLRGERVQQFLPFTSGTIIEHFGHLSGVGKEKMAEDLDAMRAAARSGKIVVLKAWPGFSWMDADMMQKPHAELAQLARERLTFPLACFLVMAEANCYFCYTWGYRETNGTFEWYPEFDKPLGPPQGEAQREGWAYHREFKHASVSVNLEDQTAEIDWK